MAVPIFCPDPLLPRAARKVLQALKRAGFFVHHSRGSHHYLKHPNNPSLRVTVALHNRDLKRRTLETIIKQAGLTPDEFRRLLSRL